MEAKKRVLEEAEGSEFTAADSAVEKAEKAVREAEENLLNVWVKNYRKCSPATQLGRYRVWRSAFIEHTGKSGVGGSGLDYDEIHPCYDGEPPIEAGGNAQKYLEYFGAK